jgi:hypothetical protein
MSDETPWQDKERLTRLYHDEGLTTREIADRLGCTNGTVSRWLDKHEIETRENWKAGVEAAVEETRVQYADYRDLETGYPYWSVNAAPDSDKSTLIVYVHRLLAVAEYGFEAVSNRVVHHENGIKWDNRPENIDVMTRGEHQNEHRLGKEYTGHSFVNAAEGSQ